MHERIRDALLSKWARAVTNRPWLTLLVSLAVAGGAIALTMTRLEFRSDRSDLVDPGLHWNQLYSRYRERFERWDDLIVVIDSAGRPDVDTLVHDLADTLRAAPRVSAADGGFDAADAGPRFFATAPNAQFEATLARIRAAKPVAHAENANAALATALEASLDAAPSGPGLEEFSGFLLPYLVALQGDEPSFGLLRPDLARWQPYQSARGTGRLRFVEVQFDSTGGAIDDVSENLSWLREAVAGFLDERGQSDLDWGVTGIGAIEADETRQSIRDSTVASIVAFVLIMLLMLIVFRGIVVPLIAAGCLLIGIAWSFGWLVLAVGHLQLLSVVFTVILLGLGIDFALHLIARLELVHAQHPRLQDAVVRVYRGIGPGMLTGAVTTAAAFGATALTDFKGMAEMGVIAGGGILLCLIAVLSCFPAGLAATKRWQTIVRDRPGGELRHFARGRFDTVDFHPVRTLIITLIGVALLILPARQVRYDPNVLNLHPPGIESVVWEQRIVDEDAQSVWSALVETTAADAPELVSDLRRLPEVRSVGAMGLLLPAGWEERRARIAAAASEAPPPESRPAGMDALGHVLFAVLEKLDVHMYTVDDENTLRRDLVGKIQVALDVLGQVPPGTRAERWTRLDEAFHRDKTVLASWIDDALTPSPPAPEDLPTALREKWTKGDVWLLRVDPASDAEGRSVLHPDRLGPFVDAVRSVAPDALGPPVQIHESSLLLQREYVKAAAFAIAAILIILLIDFRSLADALCSLLPVSIGFLGAFGLMGLVGVPLNFANIIILPLIFGIGVDAGVHVVHRWRSEPFGRPAGLSGGTGRGITMTMLTTMIGFGSMLFAQHRGIKSLGFVMVAGLLVTLLACYLVLPAVLRLRTRDWKL